MANKRRERNPLERPTSFGHKANRLRHKAEMAAESARELGRVAGLVAPGVEDSDYERAIREGQTVSQSWRGSGIRALKDGAEVRDSQDRVVGKTAGILPNPHDPDHVAAEIAPIITEVNLLKQFRRKPHEWLEWRDQLQEVMMAEEEAVVRLSRWGAFEGETAQHWSQQLVRECSRIMHKFEVVVWEIDKWNTARHRAEVWAGTEMEWADFGAEAQIWTWEEPVIMDERVLKALALDLNCALSAIIRLPCVDTQEEPGSGLKFLDYEDVQEGQRLGLCFMMIFAPELPRHLQNSVTRGFMLGNQLDALVPRVRVLPAIYHGDKILHGYSELLAANMWMQLPFVGQRRLDLSRDRGKYYGKKKPTHSQVVRTVVLRRKETPKKEGHVPAVVEWSCHWQVDGHWRSRRKDEAPGPPRWIDKYLKGPMDRPFKPPGEKIVRVKR